ncbi:hypothetical protein HG535_0A06810 [Zygotorulaspora mrakii]|uniref:Large ribosomal subunit protein bL28m n=1 Tax=Zygotorulaspora mrakii TaxID=42260 RepID=A0A7H9AY88_ZYGMR|nr:uncharacterized protein HG535_0A06810 [Zygotorulaspora mrakii]QLG70739.1 hypothetical protein HG535_0A06810 [Zygotorulaspora mrakii]
MVTRLFRIDVKKSFSSATTCLREWRLVESRRVAKQPDYKIGDFRPLYIPKKRKVFADYKYGPSNIFKQSNKGLYGASFVQYGNNIPESKTKTRRRWLPNIVKKGLWSETLNKKISLKMTAKVLRTISKEGGIDNYLTKEKSARIKELGPLGWRLRYTVLKKQDSIKNPPHKDAQLIENSNGEQVTVYYNEQVNGAPLRITVGRRKLMQFLYPLEKLERKADNISIDHHRFVELYSNASINELLTKLQQYGFDLSTISI